jgi:L-aspartate oxidase
MNVSYLEVRTDVLIVGSGGAALRAALEADSSGAQVLVAIKGEFRRSGATFHSVAEVGAFNVPDGAGDPEDNPDVFLHDILDAAQGMADPQLAALLANEAVDALHYLEQHGVHYEHTDDGRYLAFRACFSSKPRSHVIRDHFKPIVKALGTEASRRGVQVMDRLMILDLIEHDGECVGALAIDARGKPVVIYAKATILTTGGASQLFARNLYPSDITGDGYAMAYRAGAQLMNMEFMQAGVSVLTPFVNLFGNYLWDASPNLTDRDGCAFVRDYLPEGVALDDVIATKGGHFPFSSRDVSRYVEISIQQAINDGRGTPEGGVYLDFAGRDFDAILADPTRSIAKMWPLTHRWYEERGVDLYRDRIQITCSAHAINGGIRIDSDAQSNLRGLFAAGEVAAGPHGADRLGGNMSVTCQVFGRRAGVAAARRARETQHREGLDLDARVHAIVTRFPAGGTERLDELRAELQRAANRHLLIIRDEAGLAQLRETCAVLRERLASVNVATPQDRVHAFELSNLLDVAELMAKVAAERRESRGGHYRRDFPWIDSRYEHSLVLDRHAPDGLIRVTHA